MSEADKAKHGEEKETDEDHFSEAELDKMEQQQTSRWREFKMRRSMRMCYIECIIFCILPIVLFIIFLIYL